MLSMDTHLDHAVGVASNCCYTWLQRIYDIITFHISVGEEIPVPPPPLYETLHVPHSDMLHPDTPMGIRA